MFSAITSNFHWSEPSTLATLHDRPWTGEFLFCIQFFFVMKFSRFREFLSLSFVAIKMASVARKQGMREVRLYIGCLGGFPVLSHASSRTLPLA